MNVPVGTISRWRRQMGRTQQGFTIDDARDANQARIVQGLLDDIFVHAPKILAEAMGVRADGSVVTRRTVTPKGDVVEVQAEMNDKLLTAYNNLRGTAFDKLVTKGYIEKPEERTMHLNVDIKEMSMEEIRKELNS